MAFNVPLFENAKTASAWQASLSSLSMTITPMDRRGDQNLINPVSIHIYYFEAIPSLVNIFLRRNPF